jgi:hypothetical protein
MQMIFVSESDQNYKNGAVSNQLTDIGIGECVGTGVDGKSVDTWQG